MRWIARCCVTAWAFMIAVGCASGADRWEQQCLIAADSDSSFTFDNRRLVVGGRLDGEKALYCVVVSDADQEYLVYWPEAQMSRVQTRGGVLANSILIGAAKNTETTLKIGVNLEPFTVRVPISDKSGAVPIAEYPAGVEWQAVTKFFGALPINNSSGKFRPVDFELTSGRTLEGICYLRYVDYESSNSGTPEEINFELPPDIWKDASLVEGPPDFMKAHSLGDAPYSLAYEYKGQLPQPSTIALTITNLDGKELATIPAVACAGWR